MEGATDPIIDQINSSILTLRKHINLKGFFTFRSYYEGRICEVRYCYGKDPKSESIGLILKFRDREIKSASQRLSTSTQLSMVYTLTNFLMSYGVS